MSNPLDNRQPEPAVQLSTQMGGVVFPEGTRSVLFFGKQGLGPYCYGEAVDCGDPAVTARRAEHAYPYASYVWAYDAIDLAAVKSGQRQPWEVKPYAVWTLDLPFNYPNARINGAAYDPQTGRIFVSAIGDGSIPLIHVFTVARRPHRQPCIGIVTLESPGGGPGERDQGRDGGGCGPESRWRADAPRPSAAASARRRSRRRFPSAPRKRC